MRYGKIRRMARVHKGMNEVIDRWWMKCKQVEVILCNKSTWWDFVSGCAWNAFSKNKPRP